MGNVGFTQAKRMAVSCLRENRFAFETRRDIEEKNWLFTGKVTAAQAADIVERTRGNQSEKSAHHNDTSIDVWIFKPSGGWYVKFYFIGDGEATMVSISLHQSQK
ncbi:MAG: hypothetical protein ACYCW6_23770 [Candidatus Xenobia bacterium]